MRHLVSPWTRRSTGVLQIVESLELEQAKLHTCSQHAIGCGAKLN